MSECAAKILCRTHVMCCSKHPVLLEKDLLWNIWICNGCDLHDLEIMDLTFVWYSKLLW